MQWFLFFPVVGVGIEIVLNSSLVSFWVELRQWLVLEFLCFSGSRIFFLDAFPCVFVAWAAVGLWHFLYLIFD